MLFNVVYLLSIISSTFKIAFISADESLQIWILREVNFFEEKIFLRDAECFLCAVFILGRSLNQNLFRRH